VRRSAFKKGSIPRAVAMPSHFSHSARLSTFRVPRWGAPALPSFCCCLRSVTPWWLALFNHRSASRIFIRQPGCSPSPAVTQDDDRRPCGGEERVGPWPPPYPQLQGCSSSVLGRRVHRAGVRLGVGSGPLLPSVIGGEGRSPSVALAAAACLAPRPERLWLLPVLPPTAWAERGCPSAARVSIASCAGRPRPGPPCAVGCTGGVAQHVVRREGGTHVLGQPRARTGVRTCRCALGRSPFVGAVLVGRWPLSSVLRGWSP
jgi:hypothetical protein